MKKYLALPFICLVLLYFISCSQNRNSILDINNSKETSNIIKKDTLDTKQLIIITAEGWNDVKGKLCCFEKRENQWLLMSSNQVVVGINGMGIGLGIKSFYFPDAPVKKEGDLRAPAGIFKIGTAFGYASIKKVPWLKVPYTEAISELLCIDDGNSSSYNKLVYSDKTKKDWKSYELMHRKDEMYKWGVFIEHNSNEPKSGKGSCIFLHIWESDSNGTAGCSAMAEADIFNLLRWVDASQKPLLIQFPIKEYEKISETTDLPKL